MISSFTPQAYCTAVRVLAISVSLQFQYNTTLPSSAAVERLFSLGKDILKPKRCGLKWRTLWNVSLFERQLTDFCFQNFCYYQCIFLDLASPFFFAFLHKRDFESWVWNLTLWPGCRTVSNNGSGSGLAPAQNILAAQVWFGFTWAPFSRFRFGSGSLK